MCRSTPSSSWTSDRRPGARGEPAARAPARPLKARFLPLIPAAVTALRAGFVLLQESSIKSPWKRNLENRNEDLQTDTSFTLTPGSVRVCRRSAGHGSGAGGKPGERPADPCRELDPSVA